MMTFDEIISGIQTCTITDGDAFDLFVDDIGVAAEIIHLSINQKEHLIRHLLENVERQPDPEFTSWSLIHFIESLDGEGNTNYNQQVFESLKRNPKYLTVILVNRILNSLPAASEERHLFLEALKSVASDNNVNELVRAEAREFYEYQLKKQA